MKVLHLSTDNIFIDEAIHQFNQCELDQNDLLVWSDSPELKKVSTHPIVVLSDDTDLLTDITSRYDLLVFHSLTIANAKVILNNIKPKQKTIWMLHGYEAYNTSKFSRKDLISKETLKILGKKKTINLKQAVRPIVERFITTDNQLILKAAKKVDYLGILYIEEFNFIRSKFDMNASWFPFSYYPLDKIVGPDNNNLVDGKMILIGNSATETNNHIDVLNLLAKEKLDGWKILCPLSYGNMEYAKKIANHGKKLFKKQFLPLTDFIELKTYNSLLEACSITFMNHQRQQAVGTVMTMVYKGSKVFLNPKNTVYKFLKDSGVIIYDCNNFDKQNNRLEELSKIDQLHNQKIIKQLLNNEVLIKKLKTAIGKIEQE